MDDETPKATEPRCPRVRSRASRACDTCKARKTRCSGKYPCTHCSRLDLDCSYTAVYRRGRLPSLALETGDDESWNARRPTTNKRSKKSDNSASESRAQRGVFPSPASTGNAVQAATSDNTHGASAVQSRLVSPEPIQTDSRGHYVGPASGASFLLRVQKRLKSHPSEFSSDTSIFTLGDLPLPKTKGRAFIMPPRSTVETLVSRYFDFVSATTRFTHGPTVRSWLEEMYETNGAMRDWPGSNSKAALIFMICANAMTYPSTPGTADSYACAQFFQAAEDQLLNEQGDVHLTSVQARLMQCFFLLSHSRINHCWSLFGTTAHLGLALGIHRKSRVDPRNPNYVDHECRKRTFWCAYTLDTYLSAALGRPRVFHDDDIDQELPLCVNDSELQPQVLPQVLGTGQQSVASGMVAHIRLSRIVGRLLREMYGIRTLSTADQSRLATKYAGELEDWRRDVLPLISTEGVDPSMLQPIFVRQQNVLNFAYWHAQILIYRPSLLKNFAKLTDLGNSRDTANQGETIEQNIERCVEAAMSVVQRVDHLSCLGQLHPTYWFTHYFTFCAVVTLYVHCIQRRNAPMETYLSAFKAATKCQLQIEKLAIPGSLAHRYGTVLQELRTELLRLNNQLLLRIAEAQDGEASELMREGDEVLFPQTGDVELTLAGVPDLDPGISGLEGPSLLPSDESLWFTQESPGNHILQMTGWDRFDSLVSGGIGGLDFMSTGQDVQHVASWDAGTNGGFGDL